MASIATFVLPAPVGAQMSKFSLVLYTVSNTIDWILFRVSTPLNPIRHTSSKSATFTSLLPTFGGGGLLRGIETSSYFPVLLTLQSVGSANLVPAMKAALFLASAKESYTLGYRST
uniref:Putative secreted protein n=1 Tax=Ixodes ricinus TaxID=34613 RepID=A0A6B0ULI3_IXORI